MKFDTKVHYKKKQKKQANKQTTKKPSIVINGFWVSDSFPWLLLSRFL